MNREEQIKWLRMKEKTKRILRATPRKEKTLYTVDFKSGEYQTTDLSQLENVIPFNSMRKGNRKDE